MMEMGHVFFIGLSGGLRFEDLTIGDDGSGNATNQITASGAFRATLLGVAPDDLLYVTDERAPSGEDSFTYITTDSSGLISDSATVLVEFP